MNESKRSSSDDRLSKLPDSLIFHIFWFLPIRDVVRTTILSKQWRNLWTSSPFLNLSDYECWSNDSLHKVQDFFNRALILWRGTKLLKFKVMIEDELSIPLVYYIDDLVHFAKENKVEELYIHLRYPYFYDEDDDENGVQADFGSLFLCSWLRILSIKGCPFLIEDGNVQWDRLKSLTIDGSCLNKDGINKVLCGSPKLEVFILTLPEMGEDLCIRSSSLRKLSIRKNLEGLDAAFIVSTNTELKIETPNLETLELLELPYSRFSLKVSSLSLTDLTLRLCYGVLGCGYEHQLDGFLEESFKQLVPTIQDVESVTLSDWCFEMLGDMNNKSLLSPMSKVKFLKLNASFSYHEQMASLLQILPKLERLVIVDENNYYDDDDRESLEFEENLPSSFLLNLRTVEVTWAECDELIFSFIEFLLKYASKLEKMVFRVKGIQSPSCPSSHSFLSASKKLLRMPRSSPTAKLIFYEY